MGDSIKHITFFGIVMLIFILVIDFKRVSISKLEVKNALNISVKAATLQTDLNPEKIGNGIFEIDPIKSTTVFKEYLQMNSPSNVKIDIIDCKAINPKENEPIEYVTNDGHRVSFNRPTYVAQLKITTNTAFVNHTFNIDSLSAGQVVDLYKKGN